MKVGLSLLSQGREQFTGTNRYVSELVRELSTSDLAGRVEVEILCNDAAYEQAASWASANVTVTRATGLSERDSRIGRAAGIARGMLRPGALAQQFSDDVEAVQYPLIIPLPRVGVPTLVNLHDVIHRDHPELFSRSQLAWRRIAYDRAARRATLVLTLSAHSKEKIVEHLGIEPERVVPIPLAVDRSRFAPGPVEADAELLAPLSLPGRFLFYPASLWPHKCHSNLLAALARIEAREIGLVLSGATFGRLDTLMAEAADLGVADRVRHLGFISEEAMPAVFRAATVLAFPSAYEGFGTPPLEAMACGCPVASSFSASLGEVCGDAAVELDPADPDQMAEALSRLAGDEALRAEMRARGFERVADFSWRRIAEDHIAAYERAVGRLQG